MILNVVNILVFNGAAGYKQQIFTRFIITLLSVSDLVEIINYLTSYSFVYLMPGSDYVNNFLSNNDSWYVLTFALFE